MENEKLKKNVPLELNDEDLDNVSGGGVGAVAVVIPQQDTPDTGGSYAGGIVGYANSEKIINC